MIIFIFFVQAPLYLRLKKYEIVGVFLMFYSILLSKITFVINVDVNLYNFSDFKQLLFIGCMKIY